MRVHDAEIVWGGVQEKKFHLDHPTPGGEQHVVRQLLLHRAQVRAHRRVHHRVRRRHERVPQEDGRLVRRLRPDLVQLGAHVQPLPVPQQRRAAPRHVQPAQLRQRRPHLLVEHRPEHLVEHGLRNALADEHDQQPVLEQREVLGSLSLFTRHLLGEFLPRVRLFFSTLLLQRHRQPTSTRRLLAQFFCRQDDSLFFIFCAQRRLAGAIHSATR